MIPLLIRILNVSENDSRLTTLIYALLGCFANKFEQTEGYLRNWLNDVRLSSVAQDKKITVLQIQASAHVNLSHFNPYPTPAPFLSYL
jgi:hypothetical protein